MYPSVYLAAEDEPGLAIGRKLIEESPPLFVYKDENAHGYGRLKAKALNFHKMGNRLPVLVITDLDKYPCPPALIEDWLGKRPSTGFLFRVCVPEVEAWLLAHREAMADFLKVPHSRMPLDVESLRDAKAALISLAKSSKNRKIKEGIPPIGSATIGPNYNSLLKEFIENRWDPEGAAQSSPSLARTRVRIREFASSIPSSNSP